MLKGALINLFLFIILIMILYQLFFSDTYQEGLKGRKKKKKRKLKKRKKSKRKKSNNPNDPPDNLFKESADDPSSVRDKLLGKPYSYSEQIKNPSELGMSGKGTLKALGKDISGITNYIQLLVTGKSKASKTGGPLGNKFFLNTGGKCIDNVTKQQKSRHVYINNVPQGNIPFLSSAAGMNFKDMRGLIPGVMSNLNALNPVAIMGAFAAGSVPKCQKVTLQTIDNKNRKFNETHYVSIVDLQNMDPCNFLNKVNPVTKVKCRQGFATMEPSNLIEEDDLPYVEDDLFTTMYFASLGLVGIFILYRLMMKNANE
jgi:hypothetical protein